MRILRVLLRLLPKDFRQRYEIELLGTVQDQWLDEREALGRLARWRFWVRQWRATIRAGLSLRTGRGVLGGAERRLGRRGIEMSGLGKEIRHSARALIVRPRFTLAAVLTLGLGIGVSTAMFSAVHSVLFKALPYPASDEIFVLRQINVRDGSSREGISAANLRDLAAASQSLSRIAAAEAHGLRLEEDGRAFSLRSWLVSRGFFEALGVQPLLGRGFLPREFTAGAEKVVLLSHPTWRLRYGSDPGIVGRELILDGAAYTVVGVLPPGFGYPSAADLWAPRPPQPWDDDQRARAQLDGLARLSPRASAAKAQAEIDRITDQLTEAHPEANADMGLRLIPLRQHLFGAVESPLLLLLGAVGLVLLIASANVAGLQLARAAGRTREYALRAALGAGGRRILGMVACESALLAGAGVLLGIGLAYAGVASIRMLAPSHLPRVDQLGMDASTLAFAIGAAAASALLAGIVPALKASKTDLNIALCEGARGTTPGPRSGGLRDRLIVLEIALALMLTIGAGLLIRSFDRLLENRLGFDPEDRLALQVWAYGDSHQPAPHFFRQSLENISALPGVEAVGLTSDLPLADEQSILPRPLAIRVTIEGRAAAKPDEAPSAGLAAIDGGYLAAMGIALRAGRSFSTQDHPQSLPAAIVNEAFVRRHLAGQDPIGQLITLHWRAGRTREIVGVMADVRRHGFESEPWPEIYVPLSQEPWNGLTFVVKAAGDAAALAPAVREAMRAADPRQAIWASRLMTDLLDDRIRLRRFNTALLAAFAALALALAAIGVYGLMSFSVESRVNEIGVRQALGGQAGDILRMVLRRGLTLALAGTLLGLVGSAALTRLLQGMLYGVGPFDPLTFLLLSAFVVAVAAAAALFPARRATRIDPIVALRID